MSVVTIVGVRLQFIKAATVSRVIAQRNLQADSNSVNEAIVHTGQHVEPSMSQTFVDQLAIPAPKYSLKIHGGGHGMMTGRKLKPVEHFWAMEQPDLVLIYGDTKSSLAGELPVINSSGETAGIKDISAMLG